MWRTEYERKVYEEIQAWQKRILKRSNLFNRMSKKAQNKINGMIPDKAHKVITEAIKNMVKATLFGSNLTTNKKKSIDMRLDERDDLLKEKLSSYRKTAVAEGAGTGARSEEHTSELQSRGHLVCRLLLEKKKQKKSNRR